MAESARAPLGGTRVTPSEMAALREGLALLAGDAGPATERAASPGASSAGLVVLAKGPQVQARLEHRSSRARLYTPTR